MDKLAHFARLNTLKKLNNRDFIIYLFIYNVIVSERLLVQIYKEQWTILKINNK